MPTVPEPRLSADSFSLMRALPALRLFFYCMDGYTRLAALMTRQDDMSIVRRYQNLRMIRILHLSAEIQHLQDSLGLIVEADRHSDLSEKQPIESHYASMMASRADGTGMQQIQIWDTLSVKLKEYGDLLLQTRALAQLPPAEKTSLHNLQDWLHDKHGGHGFLRGAEADVWADAWKSDLTALTSVKSDDAFSRFVSTVLVPFYHKILGHRHKARVYIRDPYTGEGQLEMPLHDYSDTWIVYCVDTLSTVLASLLPALGSLALWFLKGMQTRLLLIVVLTSVFSVVLTCVARARRVDVFVATSAFAAVLVVFVGNDCQDGGGGP